ncbi:MAG TPA: hypothetical protein VF773_10540 [Verrucomicrobiae bacterium]
MELIRNYFWLAEQAFSVLTHYWGVTAILTVGFLAMVVIKVAKRDNDWRARQLIVFVPLAIAFSKLLWGALMRSPGTGSRPDWTFQVILILLAAQFLASVWVIWKMKGFRWIALFAVALQFWFGLGSAFVAGMSITGDWL